jgi:Domain of unknown function (DUF4252)
MRTRNNSERNQAWKRYVRIAVCACVTFAIVNRSAVFAQGPVLQLDQLSKLAEKAKEVVDITIDEAMLKQSSGLLSGKGNAAASAAMQGLKGVYVKSFEFESDGGYTQADVDAILAQLKAPWTKMLSVREKGERTEMYVWREGDTPGGLALIAAEGKELTIVNLVGRIDLQALSALGGVMGIPGNVLGAAAAVKGSANADAKAEDKAAAKAGAKPGSAQPRK